MADWARRASAIWASHSMGSLLEVTTVDATPVAFDDQLVDVGGVERVHRLQGEVIKDEQIDAEQLAELGVVAVVEPGSPELLEEDVGPFGDDGVAATDRGVAEGGGHERLADADGSHDHHVVAGIDEPQRAQLVPGLPVERDLGGVVPVVERHVGVEAGGPSPQGGGGGFPAGDLIGQHELEELGVAQVAGLG